jgi:hypothetical protein
MVSPPEITVVPAPATDATVPVLCIPLGATEEVPDQEDRK